MGRWLPLTVSKMRIPALSTITYEVALKAGQVLTARGDTAAAMSRYLTVARVPSATPDQSDEANFRLAELEYFGGQFTAAIQRLDSLSLNLKADFANDALALRAFLQENAATSPQALAEFARADFLARQRKNSEAIVLFQEIVRKFPQAFLVDDALMRAASLQARSGLYQRGRCLVRHAPEQVQRKQRLAGPGTLPDGGSL